MALAFLQSSDLFDPILRLLLFAPGFFLFELLAPFLFEPPHFALLFVVVFSPAVVERPLRRQADGRQIQGGVCDFGLGFDGLFHLAQVAQTVGANAFELWVYFAVGKVGIDARRVEPVVTKGVDDAVGRHKPVKTKMAFIEIGAPRGSGFKG